MQISPLDTDADSVIWVKQVDDPSAYGVVQFAEDGSINNFVEKPKEFVSDSAIIGITISRMDLIGKELKYILDNDLRPSGEYQLTDALKALMNQGKVFRPGTVSDWMDCGNKAITGNQLQNVGLFTRQARTKRGEHHP